MKKKDLYENILQIRNRGESAALATIIAVEGSSPGKQGAKMLICENGETEGTIGGGLMEKIVCEEAEKVIENGISKLVHIDLTGKEPGDMICGGIATVYIEAIIPQPVIYIMGAGHIGSCLVKLSKMLDYRIVVCDNRSDYANSERFPEADEIMTDEYDQIFPRLTVGVSACIVIVTHKHIHDQLVLQWALGTKAKYIGMIGSRSKKEQVYDNLAAMGFLREEIEKRVHTPVGLDIGAETPAEISVSIMAQIIQQMRREGASAGTAEC
ncbi:MAG: XdhC/CoxI family protein [Syntrophobacterales bacterium]|jgi:xanthine dehydrogenase accessory factor|nr:XdhC/CoxI family protein [Syntrophobacterales bacterium]